MEMWYKKTSSTILILFLMGFLVKAQRSGVRYLERLDAKRYHWGFYLGSQYYGYKVAYDNRVDGLDGSFADIPNATGAHVGLVGGLRLNPYIAFRVEPGFVFLAKTRIRFVNPVLNTGTLDEPVYPSNDILINELKLPIYMKINGHRGGNIRPFLMLGFSYGYNFSSNENSEDDNESGVFRGTAHNFTYEFGIGLDFYTPYFKVSPAIKAVYNFNNQFVKDKDVNSSYTVYIKSLQARGVFLSLYFE